MKNIAIIGSGSFGSALSYVLKKNNHNVKIWSYTDEECELINKEHKCMYLNDFKLDESIKCYRDYIETIKDTDYIILATPSNAIRQTCKDIKDFITEQKIILVSKGMEENKLLSEIIKEELNKNVSVLMGPSHAEQIVKNVKTFVESNDKEVINLFENDFFKVIYNEDIVGMEVGASLKNIISIYMGIAEEKGYETNTTSYILTEGLKEIKDIGIYLGAKEETFYGLSGLGDLLTTSLSLDSRNKRAGIMLAKGMNIKKIKEELKTVEGISALESAINIIKKSNLNCILINNLYDFIYNKKNLVI